MTLSFAVDLRFTLSTVDWREDCLLSRIRELDSLRGLAAIGVVLHHALFQTGAVWVVHVNFLAATPAYALVHGRAFVLLFFVLSGYVLSASLASTRPSLKSYAIWSAQRAVRLIVPALASVAFAALLYELTFDGRWARESFWLEFVSWPSPPTLPLILSEGLLLVRPTLNNVLWSLVIEVRVTLLIPLMIWFAHSRDNQIKLLLLSVGIATLAGGATPELLYFADDPLQNLQSVLELQFPFALGICLHRSGLSAVRAGRSTQLAALLALLGLARAPSDFAAFLGSAIVIWLIQQPGAIRAAMRTPALTWLGKISFSLYLVHVPVILAAFHLFHAWHSPTVIGEAAIICTLPVAWLFYLLVERPSHRLARAIAARRSASLFDEQVFTPG